MTTIQLPPGVAFLSRTILSTVILPCSALWALRGLLHKSGLGFPSWICIVVPLAAQLVVVVVRRYFTNFTAKRDAAAQGAIMPPSIEESSISILQKMLDAFENGYPDELFQKWSETYGNTFTFGTFFSGKQELFTSEPEHIKAVLATQFQNFEKGSFFRAAGESLLGDGIFNSDGDLWKFHRTMTRPLFNKDRISDFDNFDRHAVSTISNIKSRLREGYPVDFQDVVSRFSLDSSSEYLFGKDVQSISAGLPYPAGSPLAGNLNDQFVSHPSNTFSKAIAAGEEKCALRLSRGQYWPLLEFWADEVKPLREAVNKFFEPLLAEALNAKANKDEKDSDENKSLLALLVENTDDTKVIRDQLLNIMVAGKDATSSLLTFTMYMMCEHPDMVTRLRSEVLEKVGSTRAPTYEDIRDMKYLRAFLNETLRLYPSVPINGRVSNVATTLPNKGRAPYYISKDTAVNYSVFLMHRRTDLWGPDALEFDPDRFLDSRLQKYLTPNPFIFVPFHAGPRICLGQQFAYNEASYYLIRLLQTFSSFSLAMDAQPAEGKPPKSWTKTPGTTKGRDKIMFGIHLTMYSKVSSNLGSNLDLKLTFWLY
ncbi:cytochrome P450 [Desarmillaria ectypa]|nr:cytochrome P450 [Desarmillaria ectypa]